MVDDAYARYGVRANQGSTYLAAFGLSPKNIHISQRARSWPTWSNFLPGDEGKWFAAAKDAGLFAEALALARGVRPVIQKHWRERRDFAATEPAFSVEPDCFRCIGWSRATVTRSPASMYRVPIMRRSRPPIETARRLRLRNASAK